MNSASKDAVRAAERPSPAAALQQRYEDIQRTQMDGIPMLNAALRVEALGFRPWGEHWLGVLVTPWFMNLVLFPRVPERWHAIGERESRHHVFPAGVFEFIGSRDAVLGDFQSCSLFSPMFDFANHEGARDTALQALDALFDAANRVAIDVPQVPAHTAPDAAAQEPALASTKDPAPGPQPALSKRDFLFGGSAQRAPRDP